MKKTFTLLFLTLLFLTSCSSTSNTVTEKKQVEKDKISVTDVKNTKAIEINKLNSLLVDDALSKLEKRLNSSTGSLGLSGKDIFSLKASQKRLNSKQLDKYNILYKKFIKLIDTDVRNNTYINEKERKQIIGNMTNLAYRVQYASFTTESKNKDKKKEKILKEINNEKKQQIIRNNVKKLFTNMFKETDILKFDKNNIKQTIAEAPYKYKKDNLNLEQIKSIILKEKKKIENRGSGSITKGEIIDIYNSYKKDKKIQFQETKNINKTGVFFSISPYYAYKGKKYNIGQIMSIVKYIKESKQEKYTITDNYQGIVYIDVIKKPIIEAFNLILKDLDKEPEKLTDKVLSLFGRSYNTKITSKNYAQVLVDFALRKFI